MVPDPTQHEPAVPPAFQREWDLLKAQVKYPLADQDIMKLVSGDSTQIEAVAKKLHDQAVAQAQATPPAPPAAPAATGTPPAVPAPVQPSSTPSPAPAPAPVPGPGQGMPPEAIADARYNELAYKVNVGTAEPHERKEFFESALRNAWNEQAGKMNARHAA